MPRTNKFTVFTTLLTLGNAFCGFQCILKVFNFEPVIGAWFILLAILFDALDGKIARLTRTASDFGIQLDSLSDVISFGVAPAILIWYTLDDVLRLHPGINWFISAIFLACVILRLARFNLKTSTSAEKHVYFEGLPSPAAAGWIATAILFIPPNLVKFQVGIGYFFFHGLICLFPLVSVLLSILMISEIRYIHFFGYFLSGKKSALKIFELLLLIFLVPLKPPFVLWIVFSLFVLYPLLNNLFFIRRARALPGGIPEKPPGQANPIEPSTTEDQKTRCP